MVSVTPRASTLVTLECRGDGQQRGRAHGEHLRSLIEVGLGQWSEHLRDVLDISPESYLYDLVHTTGYRAATERWAPDLLAEIEGIAESSNQPFEWIFAYNVLDEEWDFRRGAVRQASAPACTVAGFRAATSGCRIIGQTMDIPSVHDGTQVVVHLSPEDGPDVLVFTVAGMIVNMGVNAVGVGVVANSLPMLPKSRDGVPVPFILRALLSCQSAEQAKAMLESVPHASGQHYLVGDPNGFVSSECGASGVFHDERVTDTVAHTNHLLVCELPYPQAAATSNSQRRMARIAKLLPTLRTPADLERAFADRTAPISQTPRRDFKSMTVGAMVAELAVPPRVRIAPGPPHEFDFQDASPASWQ